MKQTPRIYYTDTQTHRKHRCGSVGRKAILFIPSLVILIGGKADIE